MKIIGCIWPNMLKNIDVFTCPTCTREMLPLFTSCVCEHCDGDLKADWFQGFIVYQPHRIGTCDPFLIFPTPMDAVLWRSAKNLHPCEIRKVYCEHPIAWRESIAHPKTIRTSKQVYAIYADHRFPPGRGRAFLAPRENPIPLDECNETTSASC